MTDTIQEGDSLCLRFDDVAPKGDAIATEGAPKPVFASGIVPGEEARVTVRRIKRNWIAVDVEEITDVSADRVEPRCPLFETCSGCQLQHVAYPRQLELKRTIVRKELTRAGLEFADDVVRAPIGAENPWYYRNHARFTVKEGRLGFVRRFRRQWFEVPHCYLMEPPINDLLERAAGKLGDATQCNIRVGSPPQPLMVQPVLPLEELGIETGQKSLTQTLHGHSFRVSAPSFFQVNRAQAEQLIDVVRNEIGEAPDATVVDAYAGVGTFAALLADKVGKVIAIEESGPAIEDAKVATAGIENIEVRIGKAEEILPTLEGPVDYVILDPPRSGCQPPVLEAMAKFGPSTLIYVSCDPASLARDLVTLCSENGGFELAYVQPVDMFPHTHHIENVAVLRRPSASS